MGRLTVAGAMVLLLMCAPAARADSVVLVEDGPSTAFPAETHVWQSPEANFRAQGSRGDAQLYFDDGDPGHQYSVILSAPQGQALVAGGVYDGAPADYQASRPGLSIIGDGRGCTGGRFQILDIGFGPGDVIERLWAVFACGPDRPASFGEVRFGMAGDLAPGRVRWPATDRGWAGSPVPVAFTAPKAVTVSGVVLTGSGAGAFQIGTDGCSGKALAAGARCSVPVACRAAAAGEATAKLRFTLSDGTTRESVLEGFAYGGTSRLTIDSEPGDPVGKGVDRAYAPGPATFSAAGRLSDIGARIGSGDVSWQIAMVPPKGDILAPGTFSPVARFPFQYAGAGLQAAVTEGSTFRDCAELDASSFTIDSMRAWPDGDPRSFSASFVQHCKGATGSLRGTLSLRDGDATPLPAWIRHGTASGVPGASVAFFSEPGDYVGQSVVEQWSAPDDDVAVTGDGNMVRITAGGGVAGGIVIVARAPAGTALAPGVYDHAAEEGAGDAQHPELDVTINHLQGADFGRFEILDYATRADGSVERLWMVFEGGGDDALGAAHFGEVRIGLGDRALVPARVRFPAGEAGRPTRVVPVSFTAPRALQLAPAQLAGADPGAFAIRYDGCSGRPLAAGERCSVWVRHRSAQPGTVRAVLRLASVDGTAFESALDGFAWGGTTRVDLVSDGGDYIGQGETYAYTPATARLAVAAATTGIDIRLRSPLDTWRLLVAPAAGETFAAPHTYAPAQWWFNAGPGPYMALFGNGRSCDYLADSSFSVDELRFFPSGDVRSAVVGVDQHCDGGEPFHGTWSFRGGDQTPPAPWILTGTENFVAQPAQDPPVEPTPAPTAEPAPVPTAIATPAPTSEPEPAPDAPGATASLPVPGRPLEVCAAHRQLSITLRHRPSRTAFLRLDGKAVRRLSAGTRRVPVTLNRNPRGRVTVTVTQGRRTLDRRVYRVCRR
jgi:hypothetical protein